MNRERVFSKPRLERRDIVIEERDVHIGYTGTLVPFRITGVDDRRFLAWRDVPLSTLLNMPQSF